jgi:hypothetical protein
MSGSEKKLSPMFYFVVTAIAVCFFVCFISPDFIQEPWTSPGNACINNMRRIEAAKKEWALEHNAKTDDVVTVSDIKPYLDRDLDPNGKPYLKIDSKGNLPKCPSGGTYTIGKVGEPPTCSVGTNDLTPHVLP